MPEHSLSELSDLQFFGFSSVKSYIARFAYLPWRWEYLDHILGLTPAFPIRLICCGRPKTFDATGIPADQPGIGKPYGKFRGDQDAF